METNQPSTETQHAILPEYYHAMTIGDIPDLPPDPFVDAEGEQEPHYFFAAQGALLRGPDDRLWLFPHTFVKEKPTKKRWLAMYRVGGAFVVDLALGPDRPRWAVEDVEESDCLKDAGLIPVCALLEKPQIR